jgi:signal transduction histidine kinase
METLAIMLAIAAAVTPAAALVMHAIWRLPKLPLVEASVIAILVAVAAITVAEVRGQPLPTWAIALSMIAWLWFLLIFPSGRPTNRPLAVIVAVASLIVAAGEFTRMLSPWAPGAFVASFAAVCAGQVWRYVRRSSIPERQSTKWLVLGLLPAIGIFLGVGLLSLLPAADPTMLEHSWYLMASTGAMWLVPIAATAGILLGDRGPIDELIRYGIAGAGTALVAATTYIAVLGAAGTAWAAAAACAIVLPSGVMFLRTGTALAYSRGPQRPLAVLPARLASSPDPRHVADAVAVTIREALGVAAVRVLVDGEPLAHQGDETATPEWTEVKFDGERVAEILLAPRAGESVLTRRDRRILDRIGVTAAPALRGAFAARAAEQARTRLETARTDERRRLHADLHDELGPALAGLGYTAKAAAHNLDGRSADVERMLGSIEVGTQALVRRVREISYNLRSEELSGARLEAILEDRLRIADDRLDVRLTCEPVPDELLPDILRIVQEGVTNVRRHAEASTCTVAVGVDEQRRVRITVDDDGRTVEPSASEGIGHASIRRRAEMHGGWMEFARSPHGSRLTAVLGTEGSSRA